MRMSREQRKIINAKKEVFEGYCIPWDEDIEHKFVVHCAKSPNTDPRSNPRHHHPRHHCGED